MNTEPKRAPWTFVADTLINNLRPAGIKSSKDLNIFLQQWSPPTQGARANTLPNEIISILKTAKRYNMSFAPRNLSQTLKIELPAWFHLGAPPKTYHRTRDECLKNNHHSNRISDLIKLTSRLNPHEQNPEYIHHARKNCKCKKCKDDRARGCDNPHKCTVTAQKILDSINPKLNHTNNPTNDNLTLTHTRKEKNQRAIETGRGEIIFDPSITSNQSLNECFRIFGRQDNDSNQPAWRPQHQPRQRIQMNEITKVYTDGSCINNGKQNARSGSGIWFGPDDPRNTHTRTPGPNQSNQAAEIIAVIKAAQICDPFTQLAIITD
ncbi:hypothetical protein BJ138DRAFT_1072945, partial [Hygrophoropsis aurantiaca]